MRVTSLFSLDLCVKVSLVLYTAQTEDVLTRAIRLSDDLNFVNVML